MAALIRRQSAEGSPGVGGGPTVSGPNDVIKKTTNNNFTSAKKEESSIPSTPFGDLSGTESVEEIKRKVLERLKAEKRAKMGSLQARKFYDTGPFSIFTPRLYKENSEA